MREGLQRTTLEKLGFVGRGRSRHRPRNDKSLFGGKYPFIQTGEVKAADLYINSFKETYNENGLAQSKLWKKDTLLITIAANIAESAILKFNACFPDSIVAFIPFEDVSDVKYVKYYIDFIKIELQAISQGTTQDNMSLEKLLSKPLFVPPLKTQKAIANILTSYDNLIENNNKRITLLETMAEDLYKEWFVRFRFPNYKNTNFVNQNGKIVPFGTKDALPVGWEKVRLEEVVNVSDGTHDSPKKVKKGKLLITGKHIKKGFIDFTDAYYISNEDFRKIQKRSYLNIGDLIFSNIGTIGNTAYIFKKPNYSVKNVIILRPNNSNLSNYIHSFIISKYTQKVFQNETSGASQQFLSLNYIRSFKMLKPENNILDEFEKIISVLNNSKFILFNQNQTLQKTRDLLLPRLISGKLEVE